MADIYPTDYRIDVELPTSDDFIVGAVNSTVGMGVRTVHALSRGMRVAKFTGQLSRAITQHTLQLTPDTHLHDPHFVGLLTHSCAPNCVLDMQLLEIVSLADIEAGELLTIDYAVTEDVLHRQFACGCGSSHCRRWITGRREPPSPAGQLFLQTLAEQQVQPLASAGMRR